MNNKERTESVHVRNERLKILLDSLIHLSELWSKTSSSDGKYSIYQQIDLLRSLIRAESKK